MLLQEKDYLDIYKKQNEDRLGWGSSSEWTNQDFDKLSELIFEKTSVRLSASTLKRVWGKVKYDSAPTLTTLNTLAQFSGYENWRSFRASVESKNGSKNGHTNGNGKPQDVDLTRDEENEATEKPKGTKSFKRMAIERVGISLALFSVVTLSYVLTKPDSKSGIDPTNIAFTSNVISDDLPNSVVFDYDVADNKIDSVVIQQSWDPRRTERVSAKNHQHTSLYYYPGYFQAKLLINGQIIKEQDVFIKTKGWKGILSYESIPTYLGNDEIKLEENSMEITPELLHEKTGKTVFNTIWTEFYDVRSFEGVDADNFSLMAILQNTAMKEEAVCQQARITILGSKGVIGLPLSGKGCTAGLSAYIGGTSIDGKEKDLSFLGCDFSTPQQFMLKVKNKRLTVFRDSKEIFKPDVDVILGQVVGMIISFEGPGRIINVEINSPKVISSQ